MKSYLQSKRFWRLGLLLVFSSLMLAACGGGAKESTLPEGCDGVTWGSGIEMEQRGDGYVALIQGDYPDSCSTACGHEQTVSGSEININLYSSKPEDMVCAGALVPFSTELRSAVDGFAVEFEGTVAS